MSQICPISPMDKFSLSVHIETKNNAVDIPIDDEDALQVRTDGVYCSGSFYLWEDVVCVLLVPQWQ